MRLADLVQGYWAITSDMHDEIRSIYDTHMRGEKIDIKAVEARIGRPLANTERQPYQVRDGVAIIGMEGVIGPKANLFMQISGGVSAQQLRQDIQAAAADPKVKAGILYGDTPGGNVLGVAEAAAAWKAFADTKPAVTWSDGMLASAGYWIGSAAPSIYVSGPMVNVGSIGVRTEHVDVSMAQARDGIKRTIIAAGRYKAAGDGPLDPKTLEYKQAQVDYLYSLFVDWTAQMRGASVDKVLADMADGRIFIGEQAVSAGLVDGVASLEQLVQALASKPASVTTMPGQSRPMAGKRRRTMVAAATYTAPAHAEALAPSTTAAAGAPAADASTAPSSEPVVPAAEGDSPTPTGDVMATPDNTQTGGITTAEALAAAYPALVEQIRATAHSAGLTAGATAERERITAVRAQSLPGHEALIDKLAFDGKTTGPEAAVAVLSAVRTATAGAAAAHFADAPKGANPSPTHTGAAGSDAPAPRLPNATKAYGALNKPATV
jgi:signal peptide peptidase SppA